MRRFAFLLPVVLALSFAPAPASAQSLEKPALTNESQPAPTQAPQVVVSRPSVPILLSDEPTRPAKDELVGGFAEIAITFIVLGVIVIVLVGLVVSILEGTHHHVFHDCEDCRHRHETPPPGPPIPPPPPPWSN